MKAERTVLTWLLPAARVIAWSHATEAGFRKALRSNDYTLAAFILPEQDASKALETEWVSIQETERDHNVVSIDCEARQRLCQELDVVSYPSIRLYREDGVKINRYRGPKRAESIVGFLRRALRPTLSYVNDKNVTSFLSVDDVVFIGHIVADDTNLRQRFEDVAEKYQDRFSFALSSDVGTQSVLGCYNNHDDVQKSELELTAVAALETFVKRCTKPLIPELTRRNELELMSAGKSMVHYFVHSHQERDTFVNEMRPLAKKYEEYLQFDTIDSTEYADMAQMMGFASGSKGVLSVQNPSNGDVFPYRGGSKISADIVEAFLIDIINGKVKPWTGKPEEEGRKHEEL